MNAMNAPGASFSVTLRVVLADARRIGTVTAAITDHGASVVALDVVESHAGQPVDEIVIDVTCHAVDEEHAARIRQTIDEIGGTRVRVVSDRTVLAHLGGLITVTPKVPLKTRDDLSMASGVHPGGRPRPGGWAIPPGAFDQPAPAPPGPALGFVPPTR